MKLNVDIDNFNVKSGHQCALCHYKLSEDCCEILDNLQDLESSIADDVKMSLIHIAGYVTQNDKE